MSERLDDLLGERRRIAGMLEGRLPRGRFRRGFPRRHDESYEQMVEMEVAAFWEEEYGDRKYVAYALHLMGNKLEMNIGDAARLTEKGLPAYIRSRMPEVRQRIKHKTRSGMSSAQGVVKVLPLLKAVSSIVMRRTTPPSGIEVADPQWYDPANDRTYK